MYPLTRRFHSRHSLFRIVAFLINILCLRSKQNIIHFLFIYNVIYTYKWFNDSNEQWKLVVSVHLFDRVSFSLKSPFSSVEILFQIIVNMIN